MKIYLIQILIVSVFSSCVVTQEQCISVCDSSYPLHTVEKVTELQACAKGCRIQYISQLSRKVTDCEQDCSEGYGGKSNEKMACKTGCEEEKSIVDKSRKLLEVKKSDDDISFQFHILRPVFTARKYYYKFFHQQSGETDISNNFFMVEEQTLLDGKGNSLVVKLQMFPSAPEEVIPQHSEEINEEGVWSVHHYISKVHKKTSGWLNCVETKAGIPYTTLVVILFMSLLMMAWICCSSCVEEEDDDEVHDKKTHTFSKSGLSIMADELCVNEIGTGKCFTITSKNGGGDKDEDVQLLQV